MQRSSPELSVVVVAFVGEKYLERLLDALVQQVTEHVDVIVACDPLISDMGRFRTQYPGVDFVRFNERRSPATLRATGVARATGRIVALVEDHCVPAPDWIGQMIAAHAGPAVAIGGAMEKGFPPDTRGDTALNWALYLADYSRYALPMPEGPSGAASDCNVSYKRVALERVAQSWTNEFHENVVHAEFERRGEPMWFSPSIVVYEQRSMTWSETLHDRYAFGRLFGSTRVTGASPAKRIAMAVAALPLPALLVARVASNLLRRRRYLGALARAAGPLIVVAAAWASGEMIGYLTGTADASLSQVDETQAADVQ